MNPSDRENVSESAGRPLSRVPELGRVPRSAGLDEPKPGESRIRISPGASAQASGRLRDLAERVRRGDAPGLEGLVNGFGRTRRGQMAACNHYLPANRLNWWDLDAQGLIPATQPIQNPGGDPSEVDSIFYSEFCSPLATVFGADLQTVESVGAGTAIPWDSVPDGGSPNTVPSIELSVRSLRPASVPVIREVEVILGPNERVRRKVLVNAVEKGHELDPSQIRPSLFLDFFVPQRAVGLECGFLGDRDREVNPRKVRLIARDSAGGVLVESTGNDLFPIPWNANALFYRIGVRHQGGAIRSVELRLGDAEDAILEPQIVYRIWHETLPPAAVTQGAAAVEHNPNPPAEGDNVVVPPQVVPLGPVSVKLPFRCDRAIVMMRGFKMFFLDQQPHKVDAIEALISGPSLGSEARIPGIFETAPGGRITLVPHGRLSSGEDDGYRVLIFYVILAWNSEQMELLPISGYQSDVRDAGGLFSSMVRVRDPCPPPRATCNFPGAILGGLFGGLQGFSLVARRGAQDIELLGLHMGVVGGGECQEPRPELGPFRLQRLPFGRPALHRSGADIAWEFCTDFYDVPANFRAAQGTVLLGRSLRGEALIDQRTFILDRFGPRDPSKPFAFTFDLPVSADMAFFALGQFFFEPKGEINELEVEIHGLDYDGEFLQWELGIGISVSPPITGGLGRAKRRAAFAWPTFGGVVRRTVAADTRWAVRHLRFDRGIRGALFLEPDQYGAIRNLGNVPILFTRAGRGGPQAGEFNFLLEYQGDVFFEVELANRAPLVLNPGETLLIGGRFFPQADAGPNDPPRSAWVEFETNSPRFPILRVEAEGRTIAEQPQGAMLPAVVNFGIVGLDASNHPLGFPTRNVLLISNGQTPLLVQSLVLDDPARGFTFGIRDLGRVEPQTMTSGILYQVEPGDTMVIEVRFVPENPGPVETRLVALTNAGRLETRLLGDGIS